MTDVIGEMLNDTSKDMRYKRIFIYDIDPCEYNMYPMQEIEQLAQNISECGLLHPITLYRKADGRYMILSGERRYRAMLLNYEKGDERWEEIPAIVKMQELTMREIRRFVRRGNANRETLPKELKLQIVKKHCWTTNKRKRKGYTYRNIKREWIAMDTGFSARSVQDYLNLLEEHPKQGEKGIAIFKIRGYTEYDA
ncbi:MAG: ParB N-terminal domain-containing protein [Clostridia bacterium]